MPNLENLKKQAKLVLRWHRDGYYPVAAQIRAALPRYRHLSDPEVLAASFKLGDAQELVARQHGFESWQALKTGIDAMPETSDQSQAKPVISATAAELFVADIKASCDFFTAKLGFSIVFVYGEPPFYAQVKRDRGLLNLKHMDAPVIDPKLRDRESLAVVGHGRGYARGDQAALPGIPIRRRDVLPDAQKGALGRQHVHRQRPGRQPAPVRRTGVVR